MGETRVDLLHLLEDLRDAYVGPAEETILTESYGLAIQRGAPGDPERRARRVDRVDQRGAPAYPARASRAEGYNRARRSALPWTTLASSRARSTLVTPLGWGAPSTADREARKGRRRSVVPKHQDAALTS